MSDSCLIVNATAVNEGRVFETDLLVRGSRIEKIGPDLSGEPADQVLDAAGLHLLPGMIDGQVHFRDPGQPEKGTLPVRIPRFRAGWHDHRHGHAEQPAAGRDS